MKDLETVHKEAVEHTKTKVMDDIFRYVGMFDKEISFQQYLDERKEYLEQIWVNVWLNRASNKISRKIKKEFLQERGYEVEGISRKIINHSFRMEIRGHKPFDVISWLESKFAGEEMKWKELYEKSRALYLRKLEEQRKAERKKKFYARLEKRLELAFDEYEYFYFLRLRYFLAKKMANILQHNEKIKKIDRHALEIPLEYVGRFDPGDYSLAGDFFEELTGNIMKDEWERHSFLYETYGDLLLWKLTNFAFRFIPGHIHSLISEEIGSEYEDIFGEPFSPAALSEIMEDDLYGLVFDYMGDFEQDYLSHLLETAAVTFEFAEQKKFYEKHVREGERRKLEEKIALERKKEEEARMIEDIFGEEYRLSMDTNVQYILHIGETNTGKTHRALQKMMRAESGLYLAPLRLLALEVYDKLNKEGVPCNLKTGEEEKLTPGAAHYSCTVEMFREKDYFDCIVIDEAQMIADRDRGFSWYKAITRAKAREVHIIGSKNVKMMLENLLGKENIAIHEYVRDIPLEVEKTPFSFAKIKKGDALVCFSRKKVLETASRIQGEGFSVSMIYGSMPPETRKKEMERFIKGETEVIVSTDAIGMGLNLPIRRIVFLENEKFDGQIRRRLTSQEIKQIAGRAGRKGIYNVGKVAFVRDIEKMKKLLEKEDKPIQTFAIAPTGSVFERFQKYSRDLNKFFELWDKFESPHGTEKASLAQEKELYELVRGTKIEARLSMNDLYGFLHLPFSTKDPGLKEQWLRTMEAIVDGDELPEPVIRNKNLAEQELSYKSISLHLLFLYRLDKRLEAVYWEKVREELSDEVHQSLQTEVQKMKKTCRKCGAPLPWEHPFAICDRCYEKQYIRWD